ncbi:MAG: sigma-70 family RNA polymerase sigma factor [Candidatus Dormiibacterota bacterium]
MSALSSSSPSPQRAVRDAPAVGDYEPGSLDDFDRLYRASHARVLRTIVGILRDLPAAEDCVQEAYVRALRAWPRWRPDAPAEAWLHRIAINVAMSHRRRERLHALGEIVLHLGRPAASTVEDGSAWSTELLTALRRLPPHQAAVIVLRFSHGYSNREIAVAFGVAESTVASRLAAAKAGLRRELERGRQNASGAESLDPAPGALYRHGHERSL